MQKKRKALIFDADNTLYKIEPKNAYQKQNSYICDYLNIDINLFEKQYKNQIDKIKFEKSLEKRNRIYCLTKTIKQILTKKHIIPDKKIINDIAEKSLDIFYKELPKSGIKCSQKTITLIEKLNKKYDLFIASDEFRKPLKQKLNFVFDDYKKYFKYIVSCQEAGEHKPSEKYFEIILKKFNLSSSECIIIGDDWRRDLEIPKKNKIITILINKEKTGNPNYWIKDFGDLKGMI